MISAWWLLVVVLLFLLVMEYRYYQWQKERADLYSRIMAGSLTEYRNDIAEKPPPKGGNMFTAGMKKAAQRSLDALQKAGDG
jgi:hypothetical protein